jgi:hypothetical protein
MTMPCIMLSVIMLNVAFYLFLYYASLCTMSRFYPSSHCSVLNKISLFGKANWENDLSIAPIGLINLKFDL